MARRRRSARRRDTVCHTLARRPVRVARARGIALGLLTTLLALYACDVRKPESLDECVRYATALRACFGSRIGEEMTKAFATPPADESSRTALRDHGTCQRI